MAPGATRIFVNKNDKMRHRSNRAKSVSSMHKCVVEQLLRWEEDEEVRGGGRSRWRKNCNVKRRRRRRRRRGRTIGKKKSV